MRVLRRQWWFSAASAMFHTVQLTLWRNACKALQFYVIGSGIHKGPSLFTVAPRHNLLLKVGITPVLSTGPSLTLSHSGK